MPLKLIIFDLDGTLVDSSVDIANALNYAIAPHYMGEVSVAETLTLVGEGVTKLIEKLVKKRGMDLDTGALVERFMEYYTAHSADNTVPYPFVYEVLSGLDSYKKAIISNKAESLSLQVLEALDLSRYFDFIAGADTLSKKKPSPEPVLEVLSRFGVSTYEAAIIGDSVYDMEAGGAAGIKTIAALYGFGSPGFSRNADFEIHSMKDLPSVLERIA
jgi:phosphoglycolate phosphatase